MIINSYRLKRKIVIGIAKIVEAVTGFHLPATLSTGAIICKGNKILGVKLSYRDGYSLPGGVLDPGETPEEGLRREVTEETNLTVVSMQYFRSYMVNVDYPSLNIVFLATAKGKLKGSTEGKPEWIDPEVMLTKPAYRDNKAAVEDFLKEKRKHQ